MGRRLFDVATQHVVNQLFPAGTGSIGPGAITGSIVSLRTNPILIRYASIVG